MSERAGRRASPFPPDRDAATRLASLVATIGETVADAVTQLVKTRGDRAFVRAGDVAALLETFDLRSVREAAILALPAAAAIAHPPVSAYRVGAVGVTMEGDLVLGGNLEFPGASIHHTVHAEGFVTLRARALGLPLRELAVRQARPCAHCRQVLAELAWADGLRIVDPLGNDLALWDLYPWPFTPADLDVEPAAAGGVPSPTAGLAAGLPPDVATGLVRAAARAHVPYTGSPAAIVLRAAGGRLAEGAALESVAFNPTIGPLQDALVALTAAGLDHDGVDAAWLAVAADGGPAHVGPTRELLAAVAPAASLHVTYWT